MTTNAGAGMLWGSPLGSARQRTMGAWEQTGGGRRAALVAAWLVACAPAVEFTLEHATVLRLQKLQVTQYTQFFGKPHGRTTRTTTEGRFEHVEYVKTGRNQFNACARILFLEFKKGLLNAYVSGSSCDGEETQLDLEAAARLRTGIGKASKQEVLQLMGDPSGRAHCPSLLGDYEDRCERAVEVWSWMTVPTRGLGGSSGAASAMAMFDDRGILVDAEVVERHADE